MPVDTRQRLVAATEQLLHTKGLARVTTNEIAKAAGVSEGTLFNHFARKDDLVMAVIRERVPDFIGSVATPGELTVEQNLAICARGVIRFFTDIVPVVVAMFGDADLLARHHASIRSGCGGPHEMYRVIADYIEGEQRLGRINPEVRALTAAGLISAPCFQWVFVHLSTGIPLLPGMTEEQFIDDLVHNVCLGLAPRSASSARRSSSRRARRLG